jgi:hypothetical protein
MSSPFSSITQDSDVSPSSTSSRLTSDFQNVISSESTEDNSQSSVVSYREMSGVEILHGIQEFRSGGVYYAATQNLSSLCEFIYNKDLKGDVLVLKNSNKSSTEFLMMGVFEIDARNFFMTSDGKWNSTNVIGTRFDQVKPSCYLLPVERSSDFSFSSKDFPAITTNLHAIETLAVARKSHDNISVVVNDFTRSSSIKLTHHLFVVSIYFPFFYRSLLVF